MKLARLAIVACSAVGLAVVARTAAFYLHVDRVAFALCVLIAAGLCAGTIELLARVARVERTLVEVARLPRPATAEAIDASSAPLRSVLRARLTGVRATVPTAGFASYLVGLLVMVGLLGTFLGLVEALRGAREALGASSDIDALRAALTTPMLGLSRAFGTSAAGLTASAMLGLASVFARRTEVALAQTVHAYGDDALGSLTVAEQQRVAAEQQRVAAERQLVTAERQLVTAERQLAVLDAMVKQSAEAAAASARAADAALATAAEVRADLAAGVAGVAASVERTLTPALERAVERASHVTRARIDAWTLLVERESEERRTRDAALVEERRTRDAALVEEGRARDLALSQERRARDAALADERRARDEALAGAWTEAAGQSAERVAREGARVLGELHGALDTNLAALDGRLATSVAALAAQLGARTSTVTDELERRLSTLTTTVGAMVESLTAELEGTRQRLDRTLEVTGQSLEAHAARTLRRDQAREEAIDARAADLAAAEARALIQLERHVEAVDASLATHLERMTAMQIDGTRETGRHATALQAVLREHATEAMGHASALGATLREHAADLTTRTGEVLADAARRADDAAAAAERVALAARDEIGAREAFESAHAARVEGVERAQAARAEAAEQAQAARVEAAEQAQAARVEATERAHIQRIEAAEKAQAARAEATERAQAARTEAVLAGLAAATEAIATRAGGVLDQQAERQADLEARWLAAHEASAARLVALLTQHAGGLAQGLASTQTLVDDAAGLLRASGVEMGAVAEVFTAAVDSYRDASGASLQALAGLDAAVDQAGKKAAVELLTDYLEQTREVFEHSLEVQRELFAELRALRTRGASIPPEDTRVRA